VNAPLGLSVIVITRNEEKDIAQCLESVKSIADEIIVVDNGSIDRTVDIAKTFTDKIFQRIWDGFGPQKQYALEQAAGPWVLNIDADERVSEGLKEEIKETLKQPSNGQQVNGFVIPFRHYFLGKRLRFGGGWGEKHLRLFKKEKAGYGSSKVHEGTDVEAPLGQFRSHIDHFSYRNIEDYLYKCNFYTSLIAADKYSKGERFHPRHHLRLPYEFFSRYIFKMGFLDGWNGLIYAVLSSYYVWLKFIKLRDLEKENK